MGKLTTNDSYQQRAYGLIHGSSPEYHIGSVLKRNEQLQIENDSLKKKVIELSDRIERAIEYMEEPNSSIDIFCAITILRTSDKEVDDYLESIRKKE